MARGDEERGYIRLHDRQLPIAGEEVEIGVVVCDVKARDGSAIVLVKVFVGPSLIEERTGKALEIYD